MTTASAPPGRPGLRLLNHISTNNIKGDLFGGVTAAIVALPLALAFGVVSGAPYWWGCSPPCSGVLPP
jgi:SulP family sulfate permease